MTARVQTGEVEVTGLRVGYERAGEGPPLVLLHGFVGDSREWRGVTLGLSDEFSVVAWDAPGAGRSSDPLDSFRMPEYADCLVGFLAALGIERAHVAGLSFGGALALELYRRHPAVPTALVLAGAYAGWSGSLPADVVDQRLRRSLQLAELPADQFVAAMLPTLFPASANTEIVAAFARIMADRHPAGFRMMARALAEADLRDVLPGVRVPTLLVYGDEDVRAPLEVAHALGAAIPASRLVVLPGVGHMSNVEVPERLNEEIRAFLRPIPVPP